ncbi:hypothetical protein GOOTI_035_00150 [Gordonia otitidis NBRC 100426]|uniref:Uncharacterized protein n=1 Tax=Gordonia otitidis (strain DSM 44809 / CCUG 52243 / JCM 12355 / NBRC 100426 / IFM 10032) TaxID=1108044 RepID=H5THK8_GORO1|nr:hypothetical protein GOOTI_035_00150 [Gordonia otitidis NBRC 100426]
MFDEPTCAILNLAVGGGWPGATEHWTPNPDTLAADWMRRTPLAAGIVAARRHHDAA